jgi:dihydroflavonol-4-reductase
MLGKVRHATSAKAERMLGWKPRPAADALIATAESLMKFGVVN